MTKGLSTRERWVYWGSVAVAGGLYFGVVSNTHNYALALEIFFIYYMLLSLTWALYARYRSHLRARPWLLGAIGSAFAVVLIQFLR